MKGQHSPMTRHEQDWQRWLEISNHDDTPKFELISNGQSVFIDMVTLLQCLRIAEHTHHIPKIEDDWWVKIIRHYPVEVNLDGRIQIKSE